MRGFKVLAPVGAIPKLVHTASFRTLGVGCDLAGGDVVEVIGQLDMLTDEGLVSGLLLAVRMLPFDEPSVLRRHVVVWYDTQVKVLRTTLVKVTP